VFKKICKKWNDCKLVVVGSGELEKVYEKYNIEYNLSEKIVMTGYVKDANHYLQAMDGCLLPTVSI